MNKKFIEDPRGQTGGSVSVHFSEVARCQWFGVSSFFVGQWLGSGSVSVHFSSKNELTPPYRHHRSPPGLTHHNSESGVYGKFRIPSKPRLLPYSLATFR